MDRTELAARIDHTVLGPTTEIEDVHRVLDDCAEYGMNACIPPCYLPEASEYAPDVRLVTVIGFPHGNSFHATKVTEAEQAWADGAVELDMVANIGRLRAGEDERVREGIEEVVAAIPIPVKVILETTLLSDEEIDRGCRLARAADAAFVKTSTGFAADGATTEAVSRMSEFLPTKASGGIGSWVEAEAMFDAGAERIGASSGAAIVESFESTVEF
ncbi:deoxyribose-phosphate aldolase [Halobacteriales archaeon QS_3_64_16]|nr:MAG: deoxyribose-phosphate aldolase [Halobacteriales archaeon QS_3_64_16]